MVTYSRIIISFCLLLVFPTSANSIKNGELITIKAFSSEHVPARDVHIWLPNDYSAKTKYDVIYVHDGQMLFDAKTTWNNQAWHLDTAAQQLQTKKKTQPFIIVAINNLGTSARYSDYTPQKPLLALPVHQQKRWYQEIKQRHGTSHMENVRSDAYLRFIVTELKPYIDKHYAVHTKPAHTFMMGSSMGGLISLYALSEYPEVFGGVACLSTHWPAGNVDSSTAMTTQLFAYFKQYLPSAGRHKIYFDYGDQSIDIYYPALQQQLDNILINKGYNTQNWQTQAYKNASHDESSWAKRVHIPLTFLLSPTPAHQP